MRVATRRQRAAWRVFGDAFDAGPDAALHEAAQGRRAPTSARCATWTS